MGTRYSNPCNDCAIHGCLVWSAAAVGSSVPPMRASARYSHPAQRYLTRFRCRGVRREEAASHIAHRELRRASRYP